MPTRTTSPRASASPISWINAGKTVLRGGWGIYYSHYSGNIPAICRRGPYAATTVITNNIVNGCRSVHARQPVLHPGHAGHGGACPRSRPNLLNSYAQQYTLSARARTHAAISACA